MEKEGEGEMMEIMEERKKRMEEEGMLDNEMKKIMKLMKRVIGVVKYKKGEVIRDIINRI